MGGPWEDYQSNKTEEQGPWSDYQTKQPANTPPPPKKTWGQTVASTVAPYVPAITSIGGGALAAPGNVVAPGISEVLGVGGGYLIGKQIEDRLNEYAGIKPVPSTLPRVTTEAINQVPEAATMAALGPVISKGAELAGRGIGAVVKPLWGKLTGAGTGAINEAIQSGANLTGPNVFKSQTQFDKALRGKISGEDIVQNAKDALAKVKDARGQAYVAQLDKIKVDPTQLDKVRSGLNSEMERLISSDKFQIEPFYDAKGALQLDFSKSPLVEGQNVVKRALEDTIGWTDNSAKGLDILKKRLSTYIDQTKVGTPAESFLTSLEKSLDRGLKTEVPGYAEMTKGYGEATQLIKDIESGLMLRKQGMTGRIVADQTLRRLTSAMRDNFALRKDLLDALGSQGGQDLSAQAAGYAMRTPIPLGIAGTGPAMIGEAAMAHFLSPSFYPVLAASSPRVAGEFLRLFGKVSSELPGTSNIIGKALSYGAARVPEPTVK